MNMHTHSSASDRRTAHNIESWGTFIMNFTTDRRALVHLAGGVQLAKEGGHVVWRLQNVVVSIVFGAGG